MVFNCFGMLIAEIVSAPQGIPLVTLLIFALSLYPVGIMLGGSSCGCCGEQLTCDACYISSISNSTGVGKFSREQECHTCAEFNGNRILRRWDCILDENGQPVDVKKTSQYDETELAMQLLMEGPNGNEDPPWYEAKTTWLRCAYVSQIIGYEYSSEFGTGARTYGCAFVNGKTRFKNATVYMTLFGPSKDPRDPRNPSKGISVKAIAGRVVYDNLTFQNWDVYAILPFRLLWSHCVYLFDTLLTELGIPRNSQAFNWDRHLQASYFHGPATPDENGDLSATMNFSAGPTATPPIFRIADYLRDKDCSGSITITSIKNPVITPGYEDGGDGGAFAFNGCRPCVIPYPGYEFIKDDWNQWEHFGLTQTSISFSGVRAATHEELCVPRGGWAVGYPWYCPPEEDCKCSVWNGKYLGVDDYGKKDPWKDHFTFVPPNCDGINKTIVLDFATNRDRAPFTDKYNVVNPECVSPSCLVKEDGSFVRAGGGLNNDKEYALCEDIGYDPVEHDPYLCILDDTPVCPMSVCGGDSFCACRDDCPSDDYTSGSLCYNKHIPVFRVNACSFFSNFNNSESTSNPFALQLYYANPCFSVNAEYRNDAYRKILVGPKYGWRSTGADPYRYKPEICEYDETIPRIFVSGCPEDPRTFPPKASIIYPTCLDSYSHGGSLIPCNLLSVIREITYS